MGAQQAVAAVASTAAPAPLVAAPQASKSVFFVIDQNRKTGVREGAQQRKLYASPGRESRKPSSRRGSGASGIHRPESVAAG